MKSSEKQKAWKKKHFQEKRQYYLDRQRRRREAMQTIVREAKNKPCTDCRVSYPYYVMDFDHLRDKKVQVSDLSKISSIDKLLEEIAKCEVVCANCHRIRTFQRRSSI